jgi:hypothetical protein
LGAFCSRFVLSFCTCPCCPSAEASCPSTIGSGYGLGVSLGP